MLEQVKSESHAEVMARYLANPNPCLVCGEPILPKPARQHISLVLKKKYCSLACVGTSQSSIKEYNNAPNHCLYCNTPMLIKGGYKGVSDARRQKYCSGSCAKTHHWEEARKCSLPALTKAESTAQIIRNHARIVVKEWAKRCACGYDRHVEVCHIQSVSEFPDTATLSEINSAGNLVILCRNCHWELDHGMLVLSSKSSKGGESSD